MKRLALKLSFSLLAMLLAPLAYGQTIATLNCNDEGGFPSVVTPLYAFNLNTDRITGVLDATVYIDISFFPTLLSTEGGYYSNCTITGGGLTFSMDTTYFADVSATGISGGVQNTGAQIYTSAILTFLKITVGGVTLSSKSPANSAAQAKAVEEIRAHGFVISKGVGER